MAKLHLLLAVLATTTLCLACLALGADTEAGVTVEAVPEGVAGHVRTARKLRADYEDEDYEDEGCSTDLIWETRKGRRYSGGTKIRSLRASTVTSCGKACVKDDDCLSFNWLRSTKTCTMYEEDDLTEKVDSRYYCGTLYCPDDDEEYR